MRIVRGQNVKHEVERLVSRSERSGPTVARAVRKIVAEVRRKGDTALRKYAERWDGLQKKQPLLVSKSEMQQALNSVSAEFREAIHVAANNIRQFCEWQMPQEFKREIQTGVVVGQAVRAIDSVGCYVPGGRYPLPSSLLMTVIPAQVAGVCRIAVVSPRPAPATLAAAALLGIQDFYRIGGAQAIAALAYGTATISPVTKIVGPGNKFVTQAKREVVFDCAIDMLAGPTEVVVVSDDGDPNFIAADLVAQAEHDPDAIAAFITSSPKLASAVAECVREVSRKNSIARQSLRRNGVILVTNSKAEALAMANAIAPEHITVSPNDVTAVTTAGSVFVGDYSPQAFGDYACGPNHVLPTGGAARFRGGLSVSDFLKVITVQEVSKTGLQRAASVVETLAMTEGLVAHAESIRTRCAHA